MLKPRKVIRKYIFGGYGDAASAGREVVDFVQALNTASGVVQALGFYDTPTMTDAYYTSTFTSAGANRKYAAIPTTTYGPMGAGTVSFSFDITVPSTASFGADSIELGYYVADAGSITADTIASSNYFYVKGHTREEPSAPKYRIIVGTGVFELGEAEITADVAHTVDVTIDCASRDVTVTIDGGTPVVYTELLSASAALADCTLMVYGLDNVIPAGMTITSTLSAST